MGKEEGGRGSGAVETLVKDRFDWRGHPALALPHQSGPFSCVIKCPLSSGHGECILRCSFFLMFIFPWFEEESWIRS